MEDFTEPFRDFARAGGRAALAEHLLRLDEAARSSVQRGEEPEARVMALREALNRLLSALDDLAATARSEPGAVATDRDAESPATDDAEGEPTA